MRFGRIVVLPGVVLAMACGDDVEGPQDGCDAVALPLSGAAGAPTVVAVTLEVQPSGIVVLATATDPQGTDNLLGVEQSIAVHRNAQCTGTPLVVRDDLAGSGVEESFGTAVDVTTEASLYAAIEAAPTWPVDVEFRDLDGNVTEGRVMATVID